MVRLFLPSQWTGMQEDSEQMSHAALSSSQTMDSWKLRKVTVWSWIPASCQPQPEEGKSWELQKEGNFTTRTTVHCMPKENRRRQSETTWWGTEKEVKVDPKHMGCTWIKTFSFRPSQGRSEWRYSSHCFKWQGCDAHQVTLITAHQTYLHTFFKWCCYVTEVPLINPHPSTTHIQ